MSRPISQKKRRELKKQEIVFFSDAMGERFEREIILRVNGEEMQCALLFRGAMPQTARVTVRLAAKRTRAEIVCVFFGKGRVVPRLELSLSHEAPETFGRVLFRGVLRDASRLVLRGMLRIANGAKGSDSFLSAKTLLLSEKAVARIDPQLEILANDVKASHGAAVGKLSERDLFYLRSRGLGRKEAERVLVKEFFADALAALPENVLAKLPPDIRELQDVEKAAGSNLSSNAGASPRACADTERYVLRLGADAPRSGHFSRRGSELPHFVEV